ncbi:hypothetical protein QR685DRAFT_556092 [Neurospora intermedia]|uniref:Oxidase ustYa n=1 Tax=Neurospora intermedia TaxID=5142 RepID=A0ABR3D403_NEUIN
MPSRIKSILGSIRSPDSPDYGRIRSDDDEKLEDIQIDATIRSHTFGRERCSNLILLIAVAFLCLGWLTTVAFWYKTAPRNNGPLHVYSNTPIPKGVFIPVKKVFQPDERYIGGSAEVEREWDKLVAGHDAVWIENPKKWGLPQGIVAPYDHPNTPVPKPQDFYVISILHQLHCLNMIRYQYYVEKNKNSKPGMTMRKRDSLDEELGPDPDEDFKWKVHVEHCFEYLRQGISCGGDLIIEGNSPIKVGKGHATSVTGWGVEHDCIDFDKLRQFQIEQEAKYNQTWQNPQ